MMDRMSENGGGTANQPEVRRSRLSDYAEMSEQESTAEIDGSSAQDGPRSADTQASPPEEVRGDAGAAERRRAFAELLGDFRRTAVLVPLEDDALLTADMNGIRFILAFSDEQALARYAQARGDFSREWTYRTVLGAKLLDVAVPAAGVPCGVALDCADGPDGMVFPPVKGIVPDAVAVDRDEREENAA